VAGGGGEHSHVNIATNHYDQQEGEAIVEVIEMGELNDAHRIREEHLDLLHIVVPLENMAQVVE